MCRSFERAIIFTSPDRDEISQDWGIFREEKPAAVLVVEALYDINISTDWTLMFVKLPNNEGSISNIINRLTKLIMGEWKDIKDTTKILYHCSGDGELNEKLKGDIAKLGCSLHIYSFRGGHGRAFKDAYDDWCDSEKIDDLSAILKFCNIEKRYDPADLSEVRHKIRDFLSDIRFDFYLIKKTLARDPRGYQAMDLIRDVSSKPKHIPVGHRWRLIEEQIGSLENHPNYSKLTDFINNKRDTLENPLVLYDSLLREEHEVTLDNIESLVGKYADFNVACVGLFSIIDSLNPVES